MFDKIISYSIENKFIVGMAIIALIIWGIFSFRQLPVDAVPDITNNQVQVITTSPKLATQEVEQFITTPIEISLQNMLKLVEIRSISRYGLSVVTVVFEEDMNIYLARQLVSESLKEAESEIPEGMGVPKMAPISTGLGEIYQYVVRPQEGYEDQFSPMELRTIQDWIIRRQLSGIEGVVEVNTLGGFLKQYEVAVKPHLLKSLNMGITDVFNALEQSNENTGGAYIEKNPRTFYIRTSGIAQSIEDIEKIVVSVRSGKPILISDIATVQLGQAPRYGAMTRDGKEVVGGTVMMLKGANSAAVTKKIRERVKQVQKSLPEGVLIEPFLVRDKLVSTAISTVKTNLIEGGLIVIFILVLLLGNLRAGLIVASVIPLSMLFAVIMMNIFGISANLMSLGAIDFGLIVDGAVIIVEAIVHRLQSRFSGQQISSRTMDAEVKTAALKIRSSAAFGEIIILMVYIPILALVGIEGKMFKPMAQTVMLAIGGALVLSLTYVPMMSALFLKKNITKKTSISDIIINFFHKLYKPALDLALKFKKTTVALTLGLFCISIIVFDRMGGEFIPTLEEGDLALHQILPPGSSLSQSVETSKIIQKKLMDEFPEVIDVVTKIGAAEIPTDPMPVETGDIMVIMKPREEWTSAKSREDMFQKMEEKLQAIPGMAYEFSQPIQMRFNELMSGSRADIAIKLFGDDLDVLYSKAKEAESIIRDIEGVRTTNVEQTQGMPQLIVEYNYDKLAQYGLQVKEVNRVIRMAFAGETAGIIYEGEKRFDLVVRLDKEYRKNTSDVSQVYISLDNGLQVPLEEVANISVKEAPMQISRENTNRRITIGVNVKGRDVEGIVAQISQKLDANIELPPAYYFSYGGQFENLKAAKGRLSIAVPIALSLIFVLLYFTFNSVSLAALIFTAIPLSAIGGIWALELRGMPFSISAGIGFIALFGVAVLNGIVLIGYFNQLKMEGVTDITQRIIDGTRTRLRPVIMTASVASLGFLPMALSSSGGAEVQRPLATVVIGGLISATFLTLVILPILYHWLASWKENKKKQSATATLPVLLLIIFAPGLKAQTQEISMEKAIQEALAHNPSLNAAQLHLESGQSLLDMPYTLGRTSINYQGDALFRGNGQQLNQLAIVQNIPSPAVTKAENKLQSQIVNKYSLEKNLTARTLTLEVQNTYLSLQHRKNLSSFYQELIDIYQSYLNLANKRLNAGAASKIEPISMESSLNELSMLLQQNFLEINKLENQLSLLVNNGKYLTCQGDMEALNFENLSTGLPIRAQLAQQDIAIDKAGVSILKSKLKPDYNLAYATQRFYEDGWLHGLQVGVNFSIFNAGTKQKIKAQELQTSYSEARYESILLETNRQLSSLLQSIELYRQGYQFYKEQVENVNPEMERIVRLNYQAGEISYIELLNTLKQLSDHRKNYLDQLLEYNKSVILYHYLSNN